jgi:hypothetical protein
MNLKQAAIDNPRIGDVWQRGRERRVVVYARVPHRGTPWVMLDHIDSDSKWTAVSSPYQTQFQRWAQKATLIERGEE